jgi:phospholipid/cholesterol/gamma-HCH transport system substrate-binding protein
VETKANYVLIGVFALLGLGAMLGAFVWFARVQLDQQFAYYDVRFSSVAGLSSASEVRFSGLSVGQVVDVRLSDDRDGTITVRLEVDAKTPVRADSIATIESLGVTGVSYVGIGPGTAEAPLLIDTSGGTVPVIEAGRSTIQALTEDAPELVNETLLVVREIGDLFRGDNADRIERTLINAEQASEDFAAALEGLSGISETVNQFVEQIGLFNETLDTVTGELEVVLVTANDTLQSIGDLADQTRIVVARGEGSLDTVDTVVEETARYISEDLVATTDEVRGTIADLRAEVARIGEQASTLLTTFEGTGATATLRLQEIEETLSRANTLLASLDTTATAVEGAATRIDGLIAEEGAPLLAETRVMVAEANTAVSRIAAAAETDLPVMIEDIRSAVASARTVIETVGQDLTEAGDSVAGVVAEAETAIVQVTETFANANDTLAAINGALETGERTLVAAESALVGADELINEDITALVDDLRTSVQGLTEAVGTVSDDLPAVSADIRAASTSAAEAMAQLQGLVSASSPGVTEFTTQGLPLISRLAQETRSLIDNLGRLTRQIERSPTQFILDRDVPEFRR